jgi:spore germination protein YaaH
MTAVSKKKKVIGILLGFAVILFFLTLGLYLNRDHPLLSPITSATTFRFLTHLEDNKKSNKVVYGFLPYWNLNKAVVHPELTHLAYFSFGINADGSIGNKKNSDDNMGFQRWSSEATLSLLDKQRQNGGKIEIVCTQFNNDDIAAFALSENAQNNFIKNLDVALLSSPIQGVNIDIEYTGEVTPGIRKGFSSFLHKLKQHLHQKKNPVALSVDVYASAATSEGIWDIATIQESVDYVIIMAYDFHTRSSILAGPVAPLFGGRKLWDSDITQNLKDFLEKVPKQKILLGIPFYGYEWVTVSDESQSHTYPNSGSTASITRIDELLQHKDTLQVEEKWNDDALSPYLSYQKDSQTHIIYYENSRSLSYKLDLVNQLDLGGIAIWALGYEGDSRELWDVIQNKL